ncbi:MAG: erythromycin esterase family protein [Bacteroidetes bacterium]|nr:erythromycin esterase family protein [Bacteroidota bacterium]
MRILTSLFLFISSIAFSQGNIKSIELSDSGNILNNDYLRPLDLTFEKVTLIGLGESTHGTSEFTIIRGELFKYLVENHNYTVFFLEADFNACSRVNRYIHGADDDSKEALNEVRLWPWFTQELLNLIEWMRSYNQKNDNILKFVGCDMQLIVDDRLELKRLFSDNPKYSEFASQLPDLNFDTQDSMIIRSKQKEWLVFAHNFFKSFPEQETLMISSVSQWFEDAIHEGYKENFRDSCMAKNIADYLEKRPSVKGVYFAHNGHVGKIAHKYLNLNEQTKKAGHFLDERLKDNYYAIALEFNKGSFNAINYRNGEHVMESFSIKKNHRKSLSHIVLGKEDKIKYLTNIPNFQHLRINSIGSVYGKSKSGYKIYRYRKLELNHYDAFIVINLGTPTHLLTLK